MRDSALSVPIKDGHLMTPTEPSSSVLTFVIIVVGAMALNMPMAPKSMAHVAPTQAVRATSRKMNTANGQAQTGTAASKLRNLPNALRGTTQLKII